MQNTQFWSKISFYKKALSLTFTIPFKSITCHLLLVQYKIIADLVKVILFPTASHPKIALNACVGRLLLMEQEVKSNLSNASRMFKEKFNSYSSDLVSHLQ
jgi:hypothetical protein